MSRLVLCLIFLFATTPSLRAQSSGHPPSLGLEGADAPLALAAHATRTYWLGAVELYSLGVYADASIDTPGRLASPDSAKALRIEVRYEEDMRRRVPADWRRELLPTFEHAATTHLRNTFAPLKAGDLIVVSYVPGKGTLLRVNKAVVASGASHDLILAFLDHWLGQRPVSEDIKQEIGRTWTR